MSALFILVIDLGKVNYSLDSSFDYRCAWAEITYVLSAESFITVSYVIFKKINPKLRVRCDFGVSVFALALSVLTGEALQLFVFEP